MDLKEIVSITGMSGLHKVIANRDNGLIITMLGDDKKKFVSSRSHMFTPLENITIFTDDEGMELKEIFRKMKGNESEHPVIDSKESSAAIRAYFKSVVPEHDEERVYISDIKKIIKWYFLLEEHNLIDLEPDVTDEPDATDDPDVTDEPDEEKTETELEKDEENADPEPGESKE